MKSLFNRSFLILAALSAVSATQTWAAGAIACTPNKEACVQVSGKFFMSEAVNEALNNCNAEYEGEYGACYIATQVPFGCQTEYTANGQRWVRACN